MVLWVGSALVHHGHRLSIQWSKIALEANIPNTCDVRVAIALIVLKKQRNRRSRVEVCTFQWKFNHLGAASWDWRNFKLLRSLQVRCDGEVNIFPISEEPD